MDSRRGGADLGGRLFWFFYIILTAFLVYIFLVYPAGIFDRVVNPAELDGMHITEMLFQSASAYDPVYGTLYPDNNQNSIRVGDYDFPRGAELADSFPVLLLSEKKLSCKVTYENQKTGETVEYYCGGFAGEEKYRLAQALRFGYHHFQHIRPYISGDERYDVIVDVFVKREGYYES